MNNKNYTLSIIIALKGSLKLSIKIYLCNSKNIIVHNEKFLFWSICMVFENKTQKLENFFCFSVFHDYICTVKKYR